MTGTIKVETNSLRTHSFFSSPFRRLFVGFGSVLATVGVWSAALAMRMEGASLIVLPLLFLLGSAWLFRRAFDVTVTVGQDGVYLERRSSKRFIPFAEVRGVNQIGTTLRLQVCGIPAFVLTARSGG
jgi:hypothetical protein